MADKYVLEILREGVDTWNSWRKIDTEPDAELDLSGADLSGAKLLGANLRGANLVGSDLSEANLAETDLREANLAGSDLSGANLSATNLAGAYLDGANLRSAKLWNANLIGAVLTFADLRDAEFRVARLAGADLRFADLRGADLTYAAEYEAGLYLKDATYNANTRWPHAFPPFRTNVHFVSDDEAQPASLRDIAETVAAYVGIPALLLYPFGLFVLALLLWGLEGKDRPNVDFITAWYAASLVPNVVIAGHGARAFLIPLLITLGVSFAVAKVSFWIDRTPFAWRSEWRKYTSPDGGTLRNRLLRAISRRRVTLFRHTASLAALAVAFLALWGLSLSQIVSDAAQSSACRRKSTPRSPGCLWSMGRHRSRSKRRYSSRRARFSFARQIRKITAPPPCERGPANPETTLPNR
jgi:hypothetical protein